MEKSKKLPDYLFIGNAKDIKNKKDRRIYRRYEILPGFLVWTTFATVIFFSWWKPFWIGVFIISFSFFWLLKTAYLALHTKSAYSRMLRHEKINWIEKLKRLPKDEYEVDIDSWDDIYHLVVLPMVEESFEVVDQSFQALLDCDWPKGKMIIVLATEERAGGGSAKNSITYKKEI